MRAITGVFKTRAEAERGVAELRSLGIGQESINLLTPRARRRSWHLFRTDAEQPGIAKGLGAIVGGMTGFAGGYGLVALALSGVGTVFAFGIVGGIVLAALGGAGGEVLGASVDRALSQGLPTDEFFFYEDALKQGRSVVIFLADLDIAEAASGALEKAGAETRLTAPGRSGGSACATSKRNTTMSPVAILKAANPGIGAALRHL